MRSAIVAKRMLKVRKNHALPIPPLRKIKRIEKENANSTRSKSGYTKDTAKVTRSVLETITGTSNTCETTEAVVTVGKAIILNIFLEKTAWNMLKSRDRARNSHTYPPK
jgi:hypothetical protein